MFEGYDNVYDQSARLAILRLLAEQNDGCMTDSMIEDLLVTRYLINKGRGYVRKQLAWMAREVHVVAIEEKGARLDVELLEEGKRHLTRRTVIPGIKAPEAGRNLAL